uniref:Uncharacterized protein n=1 Tax=Trichuris muris TaxID=70415 RepID=A0A5S6R248_TRIMR
MVPPEWSASAVSKDAPTDSKGGVPDSRDCSKSEHAHATSPLELEGEGRVGIFGFFFANTISTCQSAQAAAAKGERMPAHHRAKHMLPLIMQVRFFRRLPLHKTSTTGGCVGCTLQEAENVRNDPSPARQGQMRPVGPPLQHPRGVTFAGRAPCPFGQVIHSGI